MGRVSTYAGNGVQGFEDGAATEARFSLPSGVAVDRDGAVYVADRGNHRVRVIAGDNVTTAAGSFERGHKDGVAAKSQLDSPEDVAVSDDGIIYIADTGNHCIRRVVDGAVETFAGSTRQGMADGPAASAQFDEPVAIDIGADGAVWVIDAGARTIRRIAEGRVATVARLRSGGQPKRPGAGVCIGSLCRASRTRDRP